MRPPVARRLSVRVLSVAALPALLLHGALLGSLSPAEPAVQRAAQPTMVRVRAIDPAPAGGMMPAIDARAPTADQVDAPTVVPAATVEAERPRPLAAPTGRAPSNRAATGRLPVVADAQTTPRPEPTTPPDAPPAEVPTPAAAPEPAPIERLADALVDADRFASMQVAANRPEAAAAHRSEAAADADPDSVAVPTYSTAPAPSQRLRYNLQRGMLSGTAELNWRRDPVAQPDARYELQLVAKVGGFSIMTQVSTGGVDKTGLAPVRFTDQRLRGSVRAANFQRQKGIISFSGPSVEFPWQAGVQDRLSWMLQLPAILAANPQLARPGQQVSLYVIGARGDASVWVFRCEAAERVSTDGGPVGTVKFIREPRKEHDTLAEVWLDPARQYLPLRARIGNPDDGAMLELLRVQD